jgi:tRNA dimethylallyltransferase
MQKNPIIIGPTAVGKTKYAIEFAQQHNVEIISADSMQVYKYMDIGTAKPSKEEMKGTPHHLIDFIEPNEEWNVFMFKEKAKKLLFETNKKYVIVGGTGLYIRTLIYDFSGAKVSSSPSYRAELEQVATSQGVEKLYDTLCQTDPVGAENISSTDEYRIIRALEVFHLTGIPFSKQQKMDIDFAKNFELICLNTDRDKLYENINKRVDVMIEKGLIDEVIFLLNKGYNKKLVSMQALGYKEVVMYLETLITKDEAIELIKKRTRNFAKRQLTWYRSFPDVKWIDA